MTRVLTRLVKRSSATPSRPVRRPGRVEVVAVAHDDDGARQLRDHGDLRVDAVAGRDVQINAARRRRTGTKSCARRHRAGVVGPRAVARRPRGVAGVVAAVGGLELLAAAAGPRRAADDARYLHRRPSSRTSHQSARRLRARGDAGAGPAAPSRRSSRTPAAAGDAQRRGLHIKKKRRPPCSRRGGARRRPRRTAPRWGRPRGRRPRRPRSRRPPPAADEAEVRPRSRSRSPERPKTAAPFTVHGRGCRAAAVGVARRTDPYCRAVGNPIEAGWNPCFNHVVVKNKPLDPQPYGPPPTKPRPCAWTGCPTPAPGSRRAAGPRRRSRSRRQRRRIAAAAEARAEAPGEAGRRVAPFAYPRGLGEPKRAAEAGAAGDGGAHPPGRGRGEERPATAGAGRSPIRVDYNPGRFESHPIRIEPPPRSRGPATTWPTRRTRTAPSWPSRPASSEGPRGDRRRSARPPPRGRWHWRRRTTVGILLFLPENPF